MERWSRLVVTPAQVHAGHKGLRVWLNSDHGAQLRALAAETSLSLVWATTWQHEANERIGPAICLPELPAIEFSAHSRPLAWLDDEHDRAGAVEFAQLRAGTPTLLSHVDPRQGLGSAHLAQVRHWARSLA